MKPVEQMRFCFPEGDCFRACLASVLELSIAEVPDFPMHDGEWWAPWIDWLRPLNLTFYQWPHQGGNEVPTGYALLGARSPRGDWIHSVVCLDGRVVWDPHPQREQGLGEWKDWTVFAVLDPAKPVLRRRWIDVSAHGDPGPVFIPVPMEVTE